MPGTTQEPGEVQIGNDPATGLPIYGPPPATAPAAASKTSPTPVNNPRPLTPEEQATLDAENAKIDAEVARANAANSGHWYDKPLAVLSGGVFGSTGTSLDKVAPQKVLDWAGNFLGGGGNGDAAEKQTALAKEQVSPSNANAEAIYAEALRQSALASSYKGPDAVTAGTIADPERLNPADFAAALPVGAQAAGPASMQRADVIATQAPDRAAVGGVDTTIAAPQLGGAAQTGGVSVQRVEQDPMANAIRDEQIKAAQAIAGGPSAAMSQFRATQGQGVSDALAIAARARGAERAGARREAMIQAEQSGATSALSAAALAAKEEQDKRVAAAGALQGVRAADVSTAATSQAIAAQQANLQAQLDEAIATGNTQAVNTIKAKQADLELAARTGTVQSALEQQKTEAGLATANLGSDTTRALADAAAANKAASDYSGATNTEAAATAARQTNVNVSNASLTQAQQEANAARAAQLASQNVTNTQATRTANVGNKLVADTTTAGNQLTAEQVRQTGGTTALGTATAATGVQSKNAQTVVDANKSGSAAEAQQQAAQTGAVGAVLAKVASDPRVKRDVEPVSDADLADVTRHLENAVTFRYKPGESDGGAEPHIGFMADQLKRSALGPELVHTRSDGIDTVDMGAVAAVMAAAAARALRKGGRNADS
jgi:hypothetical protein